MLIVSQVFSSINTWPHKLCFLGEWAHIYTDNLQNILEYLFRRVEALITIIPYKCIWVWNGMSYKCIQVWWSGFPKPFGYIVYIVRLLICFCRPYMLCCWQKPHSLSKRPRLWSISTSYRSGETVNRSSLSLARVAGFKPFLLDYDTTEM